MRNVVIAVIITLFLSLLPASARVINVSENQETIQGGICAADNGDTVLISPGIYHERRIDFSGRRIIVASLFLTTGDIAYIDSTIVDGDSSGSSIFSFRTNENIGSRLVGLTIQNGYSDYGGGIYINGCSPTLSHLIIRNNASEGSGGGIYCTTDATLNISNSLITGNETGNDGGGISLWSGSSATIVSCMITNNISVSSGGGIYGITERCRVDITNSIFSGNSAEDCGGLWFGIYSQVSMDHCCICNNTDTGLYLESCSGVFTNITVADNEEGVSFQSNNIEIHNSIFWNREDRESEILGISSCSFSYCLIQDGQDLFEENDIEWTEDMLDDDPLFVNPDESDYSLQPISPCIDVGDPESQPDPDSTRVDLGAFPFFQGGLLHGIIRDYESNSPVFNATITSSEGVAANINQDGAWTMSHRVSDFNLIASAPDYIVSLITDIQLDLFDTLEFNFTLRYATLEHNRDDITIQLDSADNVNTDLRIANSGNGQLLWTSEVILEENVGASPWDLRRSVNLNNVIQDDRLEGAVLIGQRYYIAGRGFWNNEDTLNKIYVLDRNFTLLEIMEQPGDREIGMEDLTWDGELIWGGDNGRIIGIDQQGSLIRSINSPIQYVSALAWDAYRNVFWITSITYNRIYSINNDGEIEADVDALQGLRKFGLACLTDRDGHTHLLIIGYIDHNNRTQLIYELDPENANYALIDTLWTDYNRQEQSAFFSYDYDARVPVLMTINDDEHLNIWQVEQLDNWIQLDPSEGLINPQSFHDINISLDATWLYPDEYTGQLLFHHNGRGGLTTVDLRIFVSLDAEEEESPVPYVFSISNIYPNPFNNRTTLEYTLDRPGLVNISLHDLQGREVLSLFTGDLDAGVHRQTANADDLPNGLYFISLNAAGRTATRKMILLK